jgi:hypothetical protein
MLLTVFCRFDTLWFVAYSCEPFTASMLDALSAPAATLTILLLCISTWFIILMPMGPYSEIVPALLLPVAPTSSVALVLSGLK